MKLILYIVLIENHVLLLTNLLKTILFVRKEILNTRMTRWCVKIQDDDRFRRQNYKKSYTS